MSNVKSIKNIIPSQGSRGLEDLRIKNLLYILIGILPVFLLTNKLALAPVITMMTLTLISAVYLLKGVAITQYHFKVCIILLIIGAYFLLSYFITNQSFRNLLSFGFLRYDGSFYFCYLAFFIFAVKFIDYEKALRWYFSVLFLVFIFFAVFGIFEYINNLHFLNLRLDDYYLGPIFVAQNQAHNATGSVYAAVSVAAAAFFIESKDKPSKIFYGSTLIILTIGLLITKSRGSLAGFLAGIVFIFLMSSRSFLKLIRNIGILIISLGLIVFLTGTYQRILQMFSYDDASAINRFSLWNKAIYLIKTSPLFGVGFARYNDIPWNYSELPLYRYSEFIRIYVNGNAVFNDTNAHNSYLGVFSETGVIGLILMMVFWIFIFYIFIKAYRKSESVFGKQIFLSIAGFIASLFILSVSENYMTAPTLMMLYSVSISLSLGFLSKTNITRINNT